MRQVICLCVFAVAAPVSAQEPPPDQPRREWIRFGVYGIGLRGGVDLESDGQALAGGTMDLGYLLTDRLRFRLSGELGFSPGPNSYVANFEFLYRFTPDSTIAIPFVGTGIGVFGSEECGSDPRCPGLMWQFALGFELPLSEYFNWLLEYHAEDAFRRHRLFLGLEMSRSVR